MRKLGAWMLLTTLIIGVKAGTIRGDDTRPGRVQIGGKPKYWRSSNNGWHAFGPVVPVKNKTTEKTVQNKPLDEASSAGKTKSQQVTEKPLIPDRSQEEANFLRRSAVCLKLQEIALRTNDEELMRKAEELRERAWTIYTERVANFSMGEERAQNEHEDLEEYLSPESKATFDKKIMPQNISKGSDFSARAAVKEVER